MPRGEQLKTNGNHEIVCSSGVSDPIHPYEDVLHESDEREAWTAWLIVKSDLASTYWAWTDPPLRLSPRAAGIFRTQRFGSTLLPTFQMRP